MQPAIANTNAPVPPGVAPWATAKPRWTSRPASLGSTRAYAGNEEIFAEADRPELFYKVLTGAVRVSKLLSDGRRHIDAFHFPGDVFGIEAGAEHRFSAEALCGTTVAAYPRNKLNTMIVEDNDLSRQVVAAVLRSLERAQTHMLLLGRKSAVEKVATFLLDMSQRMADETTVHLPMSRADIADHLGLTIETVSRSLTQLERQGIIELLAHRRSILLRNKARLQRLGGCQAGASSAMTD